MFFHGTYIVCCYLFLTVNSILVKDLEVLELLFSNKHCIEASLVSLSLDKSESTMLDATYYGTKTFVINSTTKTDKTETSQINELALYNNIEYLYKLVSERGPAHAKVFTVKLTLGDESYEGIGSSLRKAKQAAATVALENTSFEHPPEKIKEHQTPTVLLNNLTMKLGIAVSYYLINGQKEQSIGSYGALDGPYEKLKNYYRKLNISSNTYKVPVEEPQISGPFNVKVKVGDLTFKGIGHTIQAARHDAAHKALKYMEKQALLKDNVCSKEESIEECKMKRESLKSPITRIYEIGQKHNLPVDFNVISESGNSHQKVFVTQCKLGSLTAEGEGNSKKESKKLAAEKMITYLPYLPETYDEIAIVNGLSNKKKKNKKKKKITRDTNDNLMNIISQMTYSSLWGDSDKIVSKGDSSSTQNEKSSFKKGVTSAKDKILEIGNKLNIPIELIDLSKHDDDDFYSLISLGLKPTHVCLGKGNTRELSHEKSASKAILFLHQSGVFEKAGLKEYELSVLKEYDLESVVVQKSLEEMEKSK